MKDIVDELRTAANMVAHADAAMAALLDNAAAEIERLRKVEGKNPYWNAQGSFSEIVKDLKHHLRGGTDG